MEWVLPAIGLFLLIACASGAVAAYAMHLAFKAIIAVRSLENSTHNVQYVPLESSDTKGEQRFQQAYSKAEAEDYLRTQDMEDDYVDNPLM